MARSMFLPELLRDYISKMLDATTGGMKTLLLDRDTVCRNLGLESQDVHNCAMMT